MHATDFLRQQAESGNDDMEGVMWRVLLGRFHRWAKRRVGDGHNCHLLGNCGRRFGFGGDDGEFDCDACGEDCDCGEGFKVVENGVSIVGGVGFSPSDLH